MVDVQQQPVCVTGGSGFLGAHVVNELLKKGYTVHATVRNANDEKKTATLLNLTGAKDRLTLYSADLLQEGSFDNALQGCCAVFHTASPFFMNNPTEENLTKPAIDGTLNVLNSMRKVPTIKKLILTSSTAAVYANIGGIKPPEYEYDEKDWSSVEDLRQHEKWYPLGKTLAEKMAYEFVEKHQDCTFQVVSMNPTFILGPMLQSTLNESSKLIHDYVQGIIEEIPNTSGCFVDVRDVAVAHVLALENPNATGRYLLIAESMFAADLATILRELCPNGKVSSKVSSADPGKPVYGPQQPAKLIFNTEKAKALGVEFKSVKDMVTETVKSLRQHQLIDC